MITLNVWKGTKMRFQIPAKRVSRLAWMSVACLLPVVLMACSEESVKSASSMDAPPVMVEQVLVRDILDRITATGELVAKAEATQCLRREGRKETLNSSFI